MIRASVSNIDKYAAYLNDEEFPLEVLLRDLRGQTPRTPAMERGHAFAKAMETLSVRSGSVGGESMLIAKATPLPLRSMPRSRCTPAVN